MPVDASQLPRPWRTVADELFSALHDGRWMDAAAFIDPESAKGFRERQLSSLIRWAMHRDELRRGLKRAGGGLFGWSSDGPIGPGALSGAADTPLAAVPGVGTLGDLAGLSAAAFLAKYFEVNNSADFGPARPSRRVLGGISEGDSVVHVLYRDESPEIIYADPFHVEYLRLIQTRSEWLVDLSSEPDFAKGHHMIRRVDDLFPSPEQHGEDHGADV